MNLHILGEEYSITSEQIAQFARNGHVCLRGVLSPTEAGWWREVIRNSAYRFNNQNKPLEERDEYGKAFLQVQNLWQKDPEVARFTLARRFSGLAARLMGTQSVRLYHDQALFKEPGGTRTHWHQDSTYMPFDTPHLCGMWLALVPVPASYNGQEIGSMRFVSGSHKLGWLGPMPFSDEADEKVAQIKAQHGLSEEHYGAMNPGDVTFHSSWLLHSAAGNPTPNVREIMNVFYLDGAAKIVEPISQSHEVGFKYNVGGAAVGELPDTTHCPLVWP